MKITPMPPPSITELSKYLSNPDRTLSLKSTLSETEETDGPIEWITGRSCLAVVSYVLKFCSNSELYDQLILVNTIRQLNDLASRYSFSRGVEERRLQKEREISEMLVNSFMPNVQTFFKVPKLKELLPESNSDSIPKRNEMLAGFIHFLLQILNCEEDYIRQQEEPKERSQFPMMFADRCSIQRDLMFGDKRSIRRELTFLLTYLGDIPFQGSKLEENKNLLTDFELIADEAGRFIYSCIFVSPPINESRYYAGLDAFLEKVDILNAKIVEHCTEFSMRSVATSEPAVIDSLFIVDSLIEDLTDLVNRRFYLIDELMDQIRTLHQFLKSTRSFLKDINAPQNTEIEELRECLVQIRDLGYEAQYLINLSLVGSVPIWYRKLRLPTVIQKFERIATRYDEIKNLYGVVLRVSEQDSAEKVPSQAIETSMVEDIVVGFKDETIKILHELTGGSENLQIISIFGMPGLGKTTLAKKLYNNRLVTDYFDERAWYVVSQIYNKRNMLIDLLMSLSSKPNKESLLLMNDENLAIMIHKSLMGRRYLIVMDDVWSWEIWDDLRRYFPDNKNGSRIIFTSRIRDIVPLGSIVQALPLLSEDQCWELLENKVFQQEPCPLHLLHIGKQIAVKCNGLPLAVVVIAGVLSNMGKEESVWKEVEESLNFHTSNCMKILELSYKHLPDHLKLCFLYLGVFPEDTEISVKRLLWLWIAEGFIQKEEERSPENVAKSYLTELINRSLVLIAKNRSIGGAKACGVHDLLHDMCLRKAQEENFLNEIKDDCFSTYEKHHRLCVNSTACGYLRPFSLHCRSFLGHISDPSSCLPQMRLVRVMELPWNTEMATLYMLTRIDHLAYLRYLVVDRIPEPTIGYLNKLEFLRIDSMRPLVPVPSVILKMPKLRHFQARPRAMFENDCDTSQTNNLETLSIFCNYTDKACEILRASPHLSKLKCVCAPPLTDLRFLIELESLKIEVRSFYAKQYFQIPDNPYQIYLPPTIKKLSLLNTHLPWERMSRLGKMPNLQVLKLLTDAFHGEEWKTNEGEFQELRFLRLDRLNLKNWIASSEHYPKLQHLVLHKCEKLQNIPIELGDITTLEMIEVQNCGYEASLSAVQIEQEQLEYGNEELKVTITNKEWSKEQLVQKFHEAS